MPHLLELFSGTGSIGRAFREIGWDVTSVDLNPKAGATHTCDICDWEPPEGVHYDHIHASPPSLSGAQGPTLKILGLQRLSEKIGQMGRGSLRPAGGSLGLWAH